MAAAKTYTFERYLNVRTAYGASFSPDGSRLSFLSDMTGVAEVWGVPVEIGAAHPAWPEQLTFRGERVAAASYSPAADHLLVSADIGGNERTQLYRLGADGSAFQPLTDKLDVIYQFGGWSPDGTRISYASNERDARYFDVYERPVDGDGEPRLLLQHNGTNYAGAWSPDGRYVLVMRFDSNTRDQLWLVDARTGDARALTPAIAEGPARHIAAHWSASGDGLYLLSDRGRQFLSLAYLAVDTGDMTYLTDEQWDADELAMTHDGRRMALVTNVDGYSRLDLFDVADGWERRQDLRAPALPRGTVRDVAWSRDGRRLAFTLDCASRNADVWVWDLAEEALWQATSSATGGIPRDTFVEPELVRYPTFDDREIPAFLFLPRTASDARKLPTVVWVHGGPESQFRPTFNPVIQYFVQRGYSVLAPNVRGSSGYGYEYQSLDDVRLRMHSVADLRSAALWLAQRGIADERRIAVMGGSYGGFMVLAALTTYPDLWAAGIDIVGIANFVTFLENTGPWRRKLREAEYGSLERDREYLEEISPLRSADKISAPLFVLHGANDPRVPVGEAEQIATAVRGRGLPVEYLVFDDEGHGLIKRHNRLIAYPAIARFLDQYLQQG